MLKGRLRDLLHPGGELFQRAARSGVWIYSTSISSHILLFVRLVILARLLAPHDFGLMGVALLAIQALNTVTTTGFNQALIQKKEDIEGHLSTAWTVAVTRGILLALILFGLAPSIATFFESPDVLLVLRVVAICCILDGFTNVGIIYFQKELEFSKQFIYELSIIIADMVVAITAAIILQSVWALILGFLAGKLTGCVVSYIVHSYRPHLHFQVKQAKELFTFGRWLLAASIIIFLITQGDDALLSKVLGITMLGFYQIAFRFGNLPALEIGVISQVAFPLYSKLQDRIDTLKETYLKVLGLIIFMVAPIAGGLLVLAPYFTYIFLGEKWMPIVLTLMILTLSSILRELTSSSSALYNAVGKPKTTFVVIAVKLLVLAGSIYPLTLLWGMPGTAMAVLLAHLAGIPAWLIYNFRLVGIRLQDYRKVLLPPLAATAVMCAAVLGLGTLVGQYQWIWFLASIGLGVVVYCSCGLLLVKTLDYGILSDIRLIIRSI